MQLRLGRAGADSSPGDQVGDELGTEESQLRSANRRYQAAKVSTGSRSTYLIVSNSSQPTGIPIELISLSSSRASLRPLLILNDPSISGSLIKPFHPTVVRGFSLNGCQIEV